jgi:hypothetical protein
MFADDTQVAQIRDLDNSDADLGSREAQFIGDLLDKLERTGRVFLTDKQRRWLSDIYERQRSAGNV